MASSGEGNLACLYVNTDPFFFSLIFSICSFLILTLQLFVILSWDSWAAVLILQWFLSMCSTEHLCQQFLALFTLENGLSDIYLQLQCVFDAQVWCAGDFWPSDSLLGMERALVAKVPVKEAWKPTLIVYIWTCKLEAKISPGWMEAFLPTAGDPARENWWLFPYQHCSYRWGPSQGQTLAPNVGRAASKRV